MLFVTFVVFRPTLGGRTQKYFVGVGTYFLVSQARGPEWDPARGRREQPGWDEHAAFIDRLHEDGRIPLGGPTGDINGQRAMLVVHADSEDEVRKMLADDPWAGSILAIDSVQPWTLWIGQDRLPPA
jgi:uncharacterized protein YciI